MKDGDVIAVGKDFVVRTAPEPKPEDAILRIESPFGWTVRVRYDGVVEYGDGYDPDEAARLFWEAIAERFSGGVQAAFAPVPGDN